MTLVKDAMGNMITPPETLAMRGFAWGPPPVFNSALLQFCQSARTCVPALLSARCKVYFHTALFVSDAVCWLHAHLTLCALCVLPVCSLYAPSLYVCSLRALCVLSVCSLYPVCVFSLSLSLSLSLVSRCTHSSHMCSCVQKYAKLVLDIMFKNPGGVRCLVTMESPEKRGELRHAFVLVTKVHTTVGKAEEANGMVDAKFIFANENIKKHADIDAKMWKVAEKVNMFFQPSMISENGNIKSYISVQDLKKGDICWNQTCKLPQCVLAVLAITGENLKAVKNGKQTATAKSGSSAASKQDEHGKEADQDEEDDEEDGDEDDEEDEEDKEEDEEATGHVQEAVIDLMSSSPECEREKSNEIPLEAGSSDQKQRGRRRKNTSSEEEDTDGYEIVSGGDPSSTAAGGDGGAVKGPLAEKKRRITRNSLHRGLFELQPDEIDAAKKRLEAENSAKQNGSVANSEQGVICYIASRALLA